MEAIKNNDYVLYKNIVGKVELIIGETVIANIEGLKVKDHISKFKKWDIDKIHNISKEQFILAVDKILNTDFILSKYPRLDKSDIDVILTSGAFLFAELRAELFKDRNPVEVENE